MKKNNIHEYHLPWYCENYIYCSDDLPCGWITVGYLDNSFYIFNVKGHYYFSYDESKITNVELFNELVRQIKAEHFEKFDLMDISGNYNVHTELSNRISQFTREKTVEIDDLFEYDITGEI